LGYQVDLLTYHLGQDVDIEGVNIIRSPEVPLIRHVPVGPSAVKLPLDFILFSAALWKLVKGNYDLLHTHEEAGFFGTFIARKFGLLHLYDMHSSLPQQLTNFKFTTSRLLVSLVEKLEAKTIENADAVITICPELYNYVAERFPDTYQVLIENVADNSIIFDSNQERTDIRRKYRVNGEQVVLYTGTFEPYQGLDLLIESARRVLSSRNGIVFLLVGGKPEQVQYYRSRVEELGLSKNFVFTGSVEPQEVPLFVDAADVLVSPRVAGNNTPLKIYSYLRSGKPIVATRHITHTQVLNDQVAVLTECRAEDFGRGILKVLEQPKWASSLVNKARRLAEEQYSYQAYLDKTRQVYRYLERKLEQSRSAN
jgi:glycosyltransferase involved in cell wall biosynthesis